MSDYIRTMFDSLATKIGSGVTFASGAAKTFVDNFDVYGVVGMLSGLCLAAAGIYFQRRRDHREKEKHKMYKEFHGKRMQD